MLCFGGKVPQPSSGGGGSASQSTGLRGAGAGAGPMGGALSSGGTLRQFSSRYQLAWSPWRPLLAPQPHGHLRWQAHWHGARDGHKGVLAHRAWEPGWAILGDQAAQQPQAPAGSSSGNWGGGCRKLSPRVRVWVLGLWCLLEPRGGCATGKGEGSSCEVQSSWSRLSTPPRPGHVSVRLCSLGLRAGPTPCSCLPVVPDRARPPGGRSPAWPATSPSAAV